MASSINYSGVGVGTPYPYRARTGMIPSEEWSVFFDDFYSFVVATDITNGPVANTPWGWQGAIIDTGATVTVLGTAAVGANGALAFADATASEGAAIYGTKSIQLTAGKRFWMECRMRTSDVTDNNFLFGVSDLTAVTNPEDLYSTTAANLVSFGLGDGDSNPKMLADKSNSGTSFQVQTVKSMLPDTWHILAIEYDGASLKGYLDGKLVLRWGSADTTIPTGVALAPFISHVNGNGAGASTNFVDYIRFVSER